MLKKWEKFNESELANEFANRFAKGGTESTNLVDFTEDMAQEIIYYFSEDSNPSSDIEMSFYDLLGDDSDDFSQHDFEYNDYLKLIKKLMQLSNSRGSDFLKSLIVIYNRIRSARSNFPKICDIEDIFLELVDDGFGFKVFTTTFNYYIKLHKSNVGIDDYIKFCKIVNDRCERISFTKSRTKMISSEFNEYGSSKWVSFTINMKLI